MSYENLEAYQDETLPKLQRRGLDSLSRSPKVPCAQTSFIIIVSFRYHIQTLGIQRPARATTE